MFTVHRLDPSVPESCHIELMVQFVAKFSFGTSGAGAAVATANGEFSSKPANREKSNRSGIGDGADAPTPPSPAVSSAPPQASANANVIARATARDPTLHRIDARESFIFSRTILPQ
jgi:hypothetical protein